MKFVAARLVCLHTALNSVFSFFHAAEVVKDPRRTQGQTSRHVFVRRTHEARQSSKAWPCTRPKPRSSHRTCWHVVSSSTWRRHRVIRARAARSGGCKRGCRKRVRKNKTHAQHVSASDLPGCIFRRCQFSTSLASSKACAAEARWRHAPHTHARYPNLPPHAFLGSSHV